MLKIKVPDQYIPPSLTKFIDGAILRFQERHHVFLTVHAMTGRWYDADDRFLFLRWGAHRNAFCEWERYRKRKYNKFCLDECGSGVEAEALRGGRPFRHCCWKGVTELVVPFVWNEVLELIFYVGPFRGERPSEVSLWGAWENLPEYPATSETDLMEECLVLGMAFYLRILQANQPEKPLPNRKEAIREYLLRHACGKISLTGLARHLGVSASRAGHLCLTLLGAPFQQLVLNVRMKTAGQLLAGTSEPIKGIAEKSGFSNVYYFTRMFRRFYGVTPARFRRGAIEDGKRRCHPSVSGD